MNYLRFSRLFLLTLLLANLGTAHSSYGQQPQAVSVVDLVKRYEAAKGVMVVNFWSTWCKPCIDEIPHFAEVYKQWKKQGVDMLLVSQDTRELHASGRLMQFVRNRKWDELPMVWLNETNADYYCPMVDSTWSGVIPATLIINPGKGYRRFIEDAMTAEQLVAEIRKAME